MIQLYPSVDNKGAVVSSYSVYRNNGLDDSNWTRISSYDYLANGFVAIINTVAEVMTAGRFYQFVYKATNLIGDSQLSEVVSIPVADVPPKAFPPVLADHTKTSITVEWQATADT